MVKVSRIQAGQYSVSDGRVITKEGSGWYIYKVNGQHDFGPVPTLAAAKSYVTTGVVPLTQHNYGSKHGRRQSKKEFNAYLASEAKNGNYGPMILWFIVLFAVTLLLTAIQN